MGTGYFQEVNLSKVFDDVCIHQGVIDAPEQMPRVVELAIQNALSHQGVARIEIPRAVGPMAVPRGGVAHQIFSSDSEVVPRDDELASAAEILDGAKKVTILSGSGCRGARDELVGLAEKLQAPIVHALKGADVVEYDHPHWVGLTGLIGTHAGYRAVEDCDALLMVGTDFPYRVF